MWENLGNVLYVHTPSRQQPDMKCLEHQIQAYHYSCQAAVTRHVRDICPMTRSAAQPLAALV